MVRKTNTDERLDAALAWASLDPHERNVRRYRARKSEPIAYSPEAIASFMAGPTKPVRLNSRLITLAECAWPDAQTRKNEISKLIVMAALEIVKNRNDANPAQ